MVLRLKWTAATAIIVLVIVNTGDGMKNIFKKNKCVSQPWDIYSYRRGQFKRLQKPTESPGSLDQTDMNEMSAAIGKEVKCNDSYYMLSYLHLTFPLDIWFPTDVEQIRSLHRKTNSKYPEWPRKILTTAFNVAQNDNETDVPWLFYLYTKRIEVHVFKDPAEVFLPVLRTAYYGMYKVLLCTMFDNDCTMFDPVTNEERKFTAYVAALDWSKDKYTGFSRNADRVLELLKKHWPDLSKNSSAGCSQKVDGTSDPVPGVEPIRENHLTLDLLYLNDVFETAKGTTLLTGFGVFLNGNRLLRYLQDRISEVKRGSTSFGRYVLSLVDFHEHVQRALETMMLRMYYDFLDKLKMLNKRLREEHVKRFLKPYYDWNDFWCTSRLDNDLFVSDLDRSWDSDNDISERFISDKQLWVIESLKKNDETSKVPLFNHKSLDKINIYKTQITLTAKEYGIPLDSRFGALKDLPNEHIQTTILCAHVLVEFLKKIFSHINFRATQSLVKLSTSTHFKRFQEYAQDYQKHIFTPEHEARSVKVCSTQTIGV